MKSLKKKLRIPVFKMQEPSQEITALRILSQILLTHAPTPYSSICFNTVLPSTPKVPDRTVPLVRPGYKSVCVYRKHFSCPYISFILKSRVSNLFMAQGHTCYCRLVPCTHVFS
jgi:hypothetical protein